MALRPPIARQLPDAAQTQSQADHIAWAKEWQVELDLRSEREIGFFKAIPDAAPGDITLLGGYRAAQDHEVIAAALLTFLDVPANAANYVIVQVGRLRGDGGPVTDIIATSATNSVGWTGGKTGTLNLNQQAVQVKKGEWVWCMMLKAGAGQTVYFTTVSITVKRT